jgi:ABC-2 type transport system permease protein
MIKARAILWAQWRTLRNSYPLGGTGWTGLVGALWYGFWTLAAFAGARVIADPANLPLLKTALPGAMLLMLLYWQVVPLLMAATGSSLDLRRLQVYPIAVSELFGIEVLLRITAAIEMMVVLTGVAAGLLLNPSLAWWSALAIAPFVLFNLFLAVGLRDLLMRVLARKRIREVVVILMVMATALPQVLLSRGAPPGAGRLRFLLTSDSWAGWPWAAAANLAQGFNPANSFLILMVWTVATAVFGRWQFTRTLAFDAEAAGARDTGPKRRRGLMEGFFNLPSTLLSDPMAALVEKELRSLVRSPRFRLVFLMGFTFGVMVFILPMSVGRGRFFGGNYLTVVSVYSLLLLSEACFWNSFGFDRSAAQIYFLAPVPFARILIAKNLSALLFIALEIGAVTCVCLLMRMPLSLEKAMEAYSVTAVVTIFLLCAGNLLSIHQARGVNPNAQFRAKSAGRVQAMLVFIYPVAFVPIGLAYLARRVFETDWAFFGVLAFDAMVGLVVYQVALESAVSAAGRLKESMIAALSTNEGPIAS